MENKEISVRSIDDLVFNPNAMSSMMELSKIMATSICTVPKHLQGNVGDCFAVIMQAVQWKMNCFAVAQKTHLVNGVLGYEAQLVNSVINTMAPIKGRLKFEWRGDWDKYINGGMQKSAEIGLCVVVSGILQGDDKSTDNITYLAPQMVRNSPLWKTDPKQQLAYLGIKKWARLYCPDVIMGVYTVDEVEEFAGEKNINPLLPAQTIDSVLSAIASMAIEDFKGIDVKGFGDIDKQRIRSACAERKKAILSAQVVADIKPEHKQTGQDETDWLALVGNAQSQEELSAIFNAMPNEAQAQLNEAVDERMDYLDETGLRDA
ncbi:MAG: RecT family recombinase [Methyloglobulus sp.]